MKRVLFVGVFLLLMGTVPLRAGEITPRMLYEKMNQLERRQSVLEARMDSLEKRLVDLRQEMNARFKELRQEMNARFEGLHQEMEVRFKSLRAEMEGKFRETNARLEKTNARLENTNARLDDLARYLGWMVGGIFLLVASVLALIVWDRRTAARLAARELEKTLGGEVEKLLRVLRERARTDQELATIMRNLGLL